MRLWSLHPEYLDRKGLVALWREGLLARKVLQGQTRGYRNHAQLIRFRAQCDPVAAIDYYLRAVYEESLRRGYHFDGAKLAEATPPPPKVAVTDGQLRYEAAHLARKLEQRDRERYRQIVSVAVPGAHPLFTRVAGEIEEWERLS